jgi:hypothetical protein
MKNLYFILAFICFQSFSQSTPTLDVAGSIKVKGNNPIELGVGFTKQLDAGKIVYSRWTPNTLELVGGGINDQIRKIKFWNEGGASFVGNLGVGVDNPSEKLDVNGLVYTRQGIKFPDQSVQNTAANTTYPFENSFPRKQPFIIITTGNSPVIIDTLEVVEIGGGGVESVVSIQSGIKQVSPPRIIQFSLKINFENATQTLLQRLSIGTSPISKFTIYYPDINSSNYQKAIELRDAYITSINFSSNFVGNNQYANLLVLSVTAEQVEIRSINTSSCFCWDFINSAACTCD